MRYAAVIKKADGNFSAYVPDLPGCVATAGTREEAKNDIREAIRFHLDGLKADRLPAPTPHATLPSRPMACRRSTYVQVSGRGESDK
jgi:predicted RNase H-like HicB family nuclease